MNDSHLIERIKDYYRITLRFDGNEYVVLEDAYKFDTDPKDYTFDDRVYWQWENGNYSCDCNKSIFIIKQCEAKFPEMTCGDTVELVSIERNQKS